jgi:hypothetical protein
MPHVIDIPGPDLAQLRQATQAGERVVDVGSPAGIDTLIAEPGPRTD